MLEAKICAVNCVPFVQQRSGEQVQEGELAQAGECPYVIPPLVVPLLSRNDIIEGQRGPFPFKLGYVTSTLLKISVVFVII